MCFYSIAEFCIATFIYRKVRGVRQTQIFLHICALLCIFNILFVFGISMTGNPIICSTVAATLHFVLLASWSWMAVYVHSIHASLVNVSKTKTYAAYQKPLNFLCRIPLFRKPSSCCEHQFLVTDFRFSL